MKIEYLVNTCEQFPDERLLDVYGYDGWQLITIINVPPYWDLAQQKPGRFRLYFSRPIVEETT